MFERETRREKILEARNKEIRLKEKTKGILGLGGGPAPKSGGALTGFALSALKGAKAQAEKEGKAAAEEAAEDPIARAEREFFQVVHKVRE